MLRDDFIRVQKDPSFLDMIRECPQGSMRVSILLTPGVRYGV
jgi:hypothetical protein